MKRTAAILAAAAAVTATVVLWPTPPAGFGLAWECPGADGTFCTGIESSTNLVNWTRETVFVAGISNHWRDTNATQPCKFYRAFNTY